MADVQEGPKFYTLDLTQFLGCDAVRNFLHLLARVHFVKPCSYFDKNSFSLNGLYELFLMKSLYG